MQPEGPAVTSEPPTEADTVKVVGQGSVTTKYTSPRDSTARAAPGQLEEWKSRVSPHWSCGDRLRPGSCSGNPQNSLLPPPPTQKGGLEQQ